MVWTWLFGAFSAIVTGVFSLIPSFGGSVVSDFTAVGTQVGNACAMLGGYVPIATLGLCLGTVLTVKVFTSGWTVLLWAWHQIWGSQ